MTQPPQPPEGEQPQYPPAPQQPQYPSPYPAPTSSPGAQLPPAQYPPQGQDPQPPQYTPQGQYPPGGYQMPPPQQPTSSHRGCLISAIVVIAVILVGAVSCTAILFQAGRKVSDTVNREHTVVYSVTGSGSADLTYVTDGLASSTQESGVRLPWSTTVTAKGLVLFFSVIAQNGANESGTITCTITVDGTEVANETASGPAAVATCTATGTGN